MTNFQVLLSFIMKSHFLKNFEHKYTYPGPKWSIHMYCHAFPIAVDTNKITCIIYIWNMIIFSNVNFHGRLGIVSVHIEHSIRCIDIG